MEIAFFVEKRMQGSSIFGGNVECSTDTLILVISSSCKSDIESTTNRMFLECRSSHDILDHLTRLGTHDVRGPFS
eukprot:5404433-Heterocapsa_arctica.AAC.1